MKPTIDQARKKRAFTIVELLTVMSIIVILIGLLVPALNKARRFATLVKQKAQLHSMDAAIELFRNEYGSYPPSGAMDDALNVPYCGAMKLCEALMGQDLLGFHSNSVFRRDGMDAAGVNQLYPPLPPQDNLRARMGPYLAAESANAFTMEDIYGTNVSSFLPRSYVLCDVYERQMKSSYKTGMPILYYKADTANNFHDPNLAPTITNSNGNIYNYWDNHQLVGLGKPWEASGGSSSPHALFNPDRFYKNTQNHMIKTAKQPYRSDMYILLSAGYDGEYGTADDVFNYDWKYRQ